MANNKYMSYINRTEIAGGSQQKLTTYDWDYSFNWGNNFKVYHPAEATIHARLTSVTGIDLFPSYQAGGQTNVRGFVMNQPGFTTNNVDSIQLVFEDFEDMSITAMAMDWVWKSNNPANHQSYHKSEVTIPKLTLYRLNSARQPVYTIELVNVDLASTPSTSNDYTTDKGEMQQVTLPLRAEYLKFTFNNVSSS